MSSTSVGFTITGHFITEHSRNLVIEGKIREAERLLLECVVGLDHKDMRDILTGKKKFVGSDGTRGSIIELVDDNNTEMQKEFDRLFAGIVYDSKNYWIPYASVVGWGPRDVGAGEIYNHPLYNYGSVIPAFDN